MPFSITSFSRRGLAPEVGAWRGAVLANGGATDNITLRALDTFILGIASIRSQIVAANLFCGKDLTAARCPVIRDKGPSIWANTNFVAADHINYGPSAGLKGDGSTKRLDTGITIDDMGVEGSLSVWLSEGASTAVGYPTPIGAANAGASRQGIAGVGGDGQVYSGFSDANSYGFAQGNLLAGRLYTSSRTGGNFACYENAVEKSNGTFSVSSASSTRTYYIAAFNNNGTAERFTSLRISAVVLATGAWSGAKQTTLYNALAAFHTAMGRPIT